MGTDINMIAEVRRNGVWELSTAKVFKNPLYDPASDEKWSMKKYMSRPDNGRNYDLFAILAGVRNGEGFAGCRIGERFKPIADLKVILMICLKMMFCLVMNIATALGLH